MEKKNLIWGLAIAALLSSCSGSQETMSVSADISDISDTGVEAGESRGPGAADFYADVEKEGLNKVFFGFDKSSLSESSKDILKAQAKWLMQNKEAFVEVQGYCDRIGSYRYNDGLGQRRAEAAAEYLTSLGVSEDRIRLVSYGNRVVLVSGEGEEVDQQNRNATTVIRPMPDSGGSADPAS